MLDAVCLMKIQYYKFKCRSSKIEHSPEVIAGMDKLVNWQRIQNTDEAIEVSKRPPYKEPSSINCCPMHIR